MRTLSSDLTMAVYLRDHLSCLYCGLGILNGKRLCLNEMVPTRDGADYDASNLITACKECSAERGARGFVEFLLARYAHSESLDPVARHLIKIIRQRLNPIDITSAARMLYEQDGWLDDVMDCLHQPRSTYAQEN